MEFQIRGISENWLILKKEERGVQFQGIKLNNLENVKFK